MINIKELKKLTSHLHILYVEDDLEIQTKMRKYLNKLFALVKVASDGVEGLELFKTQTFDIVITDLSMPKMNGMEMIKKIKEMNEHQMLLITTAHGESNYLLKAMKFHINGYILKPFNYDELNDELYKVSEIINTFKENEAYKVHLQDMLNTQTQEMSDNYEKTIYSMIELIERRDTYTAGHSKRVAFYCKIIAHDMGYSEEECTLIHQAGILHDIGKIETPDSVLLNPKSLNTLEYTLIQEHVNVGYQLLNTIPMFQAFADIVHSHHEKYNGKGYPNGLKANEIPELARIMILADAFDAMTTNRIYKGRKSVPEALEELEELSEVQFDPEVVKSALVVLKDIKIDESISQLPKSKLEKERFAYFYNDSISQAFNQHYLDVVLLKNSYELVYKNMLIFSICNFSQFNKDNSWEKGDFLLKEFAAILMTHRDEELIFRIFGDDFVILSKENVDISRMKQALDLFMKKKSLSYKIDTVDLSIEKIDKIADIEKIQAIKS